MSQKKSGKSKESQPIPVPLNPPRPSTGSPYVYKISKRSETPNWNECLDNTEMSLWATLLILHNLSPEYSLDDVGKWIERAPKIKSLLNVTNTAIARDEIHAIHTEGTSWSVIVPHYEFHESQAIENVIYYDIDTRESIDAEVTKFRPLNSGEPFGSCPCPFATGAYEFRARSPRYFPFTFSVQLYAKCHLWLTVYLRNSSCPEDMGKQGSFDVETEWPEYTVDLRNVYRFVMSNGLLQHEPPHRVVEAFGYVALEAPVETDQTERASKRSETRRPNPDSRVPRYPTSKGMEWSSIRITIVGEERFTASAGTGNSRDFSFQDLAMNKRSKAPNMQWEILLEMARLGAYSTPAKPDNHDNTESSSRTPHQRRTEYIQSTKNYAKEKDNRAHRVKRLNISLQDFFGIHPSKPIEFNSKASRWEPKFSLVRKP